MDDDIVSSMLSNSDLTLKRFKSMRRTSLLFNECRSTLDRRDGNILSVHKLFSPISQHHSAHVQPQRRHLSMHVDGKSEGDKIVPRTTIYIGTEQSIGDLVPGVRFKNVMIVS
jgi:hypothetical protein